MSRPVHERLRELEADVQDLRFLPAAAVRARGRSRGRRQLAAVLTAGAVVVATASTALIWPHPHPHAAPISDSAAGRPVVTCVLALPDDPSEVRIRVLDGGAPAALLKSMATQLRARKFVVQDGAAGGEPVAGVAALRYGPAAIGAATVVRAELHGPVTMSFDPGRQDPAVDLLLGPDFSRFATTTEVNRNLVIAGEPTAPPQCSAVERHR